MRMISLIAMFLITSCTNTMNSVEQGVKQDSRDIRGKIANELYPEGNLTTPAVTSHAYSYCYKSWADSSCYKEPVKGQEYLLIDGK